MNDRAEKTNLLKFTLSSSVKKVTACPLRPALPVLPVKRKNIYKKLFAINEHDG